MSNTIKKRDLKTRQRHAFTLVELLVVIAIIGVMVGLLLPAVQSAREAARRVNCTNNLVQVGLAVHHYEFSVEHFPSGVINAEGPIRSEANGQHTGWIPQILPFLDQHNLYNNFDQKAGAYAPANKDAREATIAALLCPSNPFSSHKNGPSFYAACYHDSESPIDIDNNGIMFLNSKTRFSDIRDGSSQTILVGEMNGDKENFGWASGTRATLRNTSLIEAFGKWDQRQTEGGPLQVGGFGSPHTGGALFCFADGSTRFLTLNIDELLLSRLGHRADGEIIKELP